jgi:hypothetical protein
MSINTISWLFILAWTFIVLGLRLIIITCRDVNASLLTTKKSSKPIKFLISVEPSSFFYVYLLN